MALVSTVMFVAACSSANGEVDEAIDTIDAPTTITSTLPSTSTAETSTTAVDPTATEETAIAEAFDLQFTVWRSCSADYDACDPAVDLAAVYSGVALETLTSSVVDRQGNGRKNTPLEPDPDFQRVDGIEFPDDTLTTATVTYCSVDSRLVSVVENGVDVVFDDTVVHERGLAFYQLGADDVWRLDRFDVIESSAEVPLCDGS